ncbi:MAG: hypothetical protein ACRDYA_15320 [Egibacteraceae bacterium]
MALPSWVNLAGPPGAAARAGDPVPSLTLAGDYTCQRFMVAWEGAVVSEQRAAKAVLAELSSLSGAGR